MVRIGEEFIRTEVQFIPAKLKVIDHYRMQDMPKKRHAIYGESSHSCSASHAFPGIRVYDCLADLSEI